MVITYGNNIVAICYNWTNYVQIMSSSWVHSEQNKICPRHCPLSWQCGASASTECYLSGWPSGTAIMSRFRILLSLYVNEFTFVEFTSLIPQLDISPVLSSPQDAGQGSPVSFTREAHVLSFCCYYVSTRALVYYVRWHCVKKNVHQLYCYLYQE